MAVLKRSANSFADISPPKKARREAGKEDLSNLTRTGHRLLFGYDGGNGASEEEALLAGMKAIIACMQPFATSAAIAALREEATEAAFNSDKHAALCDSAYVSGMQAGWNFGVDEDVTGFQQSLEAYRKPMREAYRQLRESKGESKL